jgi:hypothetical protein
MPVYDIVLESALSTGDVLFTVSVPVNAYSRESACECALKMFPHCQVAADRAVRCWPTLKEQEEIGRRNDEWLAERKIEAERRAKRRAEQLLREQLACERRAALESRRQPDEPISTAHEGITFPRVRLNSDPADVYLPAPLIEEAEPKGSKMWRAKGRNRQARSCDAATRSLDEAASIAQI